MINRFEIKEIDKEERLFLYFDFNYEFSYFGINNKKTIQEEIKDFIKKNNINFHGTIISLVVGGVLVGNLIFNQGKYTNISNINPSPQVIEVDKLLSINDLNIDSKERLESVIEDINENKESPIDNSNKEIVDKLSDDINTKEDSNFKEKEIINNSNSMISSNSNSNSSVITNEPTNVSKEETPSNNIYVTIKRKNGQTLTIELEEYLIGVVGAEMPALFHEEALKAQSIVARTYTLKAIKNGKTLTDTESTQSYKSESELQSLWGANFDNYYSKIKKCVEETKGIYLSYNGSYIEAIYHSTSNGKTENSSNVWSNSFPYLVSVESPYDSLNPSFIYETIISYSDLSKKLNLEINQDTNFEVLEYTISDRIASILVNDKVYRGVDFRNLLGLRSADFQIEKKEEGVKFITKGYGHGVGMSQYGANGMAKNGYNYEAILKHYYKGVLLSHL